MIIINHTMQAFREKCFFPRDLKLMLAFGTPAILWWPRSLFRKSGPSFGELQPNLQRRSFLIKLPRRQLLACDQNVRRGKKTGNLNKGVPGVTKDKSST